jgi:hypothetical protein
VQDKRERERRGQLARVAVRERYSWSAASQQLGALLEEVVANSVRETEPPLEREVPSEPSLPGPALEQGAPAYTS